TEDGMVELVGNIEVEERSFHSRMEVARYLDGLLGKADLEEVERDAGLWAWLTLFYFDQVCPEGKGGARGVGDEARYIPAVQNFQRFYRHLLLGPYLIFRAHADQPSRVLGVLATAPSAPGEIVEQFASRQELISNRPVMNVVTRLYFDFDK